MKRNDTTDPSKRQTYTLFFNIAVMISSFAIALVALPQEIFFVVAIIILFALRDIEKDISRAFPSRFHMHTTVK